MWKSYDLDLGSRGGKCCSVGLGPHISTQPCCSSWVWRFDSHVPILSCVVWTLRNSMEMLRRRQGHRYPYGLSLTSSTCDRYFPIVSCPCWISSFFQNASTKWENYHWVEKIFQEHLRVCWNLIEQTSIKIIGFLIKKSQFINTSTSLIFYFKIIIYLTPKMCHFFKKTM